MTVNHDVVGSNPTSGASGLFVKWLRHRPFTAGSGVRIPHRSPWAISSAGRASALQAECQQFDPVIAHHEKRLHDCEVFFIFISCNGTAAAARSFPPRPDFPNGPALCSGSLRKSGRFLFPDSLKGRSGMPSLPGQSSMGREEPPTGMKYTPASFPIFSSAVSTAVCRSRNGTMFALRTMASSISVTR